MHDPNEELQELKHEAWPGYMKAFIVVFGLSVVYLLIIFLARKLAKFVGHIAAEFVTTVVIANDIALSAVAVFAVIWRFRGPVVTTSSGENEAS